MPPFLAQRMANIIHLDRLELGTHRFDYHLDSACLSGIEKSDLLAGDIDATALLNLRDDDYSLRVSVKGVVQVACDRCLDPMDIHVDAEDTMTADDLLEQAGNARQIDLDWLAYELTIVNLPLVHSHQQGGCNPQMDNLLQNHLCTAEEPEAISK